MGIPTIGGETTFDPSFNGNILVNAFALGLCKSDEIFYGRAEGIGNPVIYVGSKTGRDGLGGAVMASDSFNDANKSLRPTVQVGDPFAEKLLMEACLELFKTLLTKGRDYRNYVRGRWKTGMLGGRREIGRASCRERV